MFSFSNSESNTIKETVLVGIFKGEKEEFQVQLNVVVWWYEIQSTCSMDTASQHSSRTFLSQKWLATVAGSSSFVGSSDICSLAGSIYQYNYI